MVGSQSLLYELELVQIVDMVFAQLGINVCKKINNRKLLAGIAEVAGAADKMVDITVAIDKIDKIGLDAVKEELREKGLSDSAIAVIEPVLQLQGGNEAKIDKMSSILASSEVGMKGIAEIRELFGLIEAAGIRQNVELDLSLARGLNYYTGAIFEVKALDYEIGSICGGGRYDDLTGIFGLKNVSGVGISFGADRIYDVLLGLDKYPAALGSAPDILFANMGREALAYVMPVCAMLREKGFSVVVFPDESKLGKQFDYATRNGIPFISINADSEAAAGTVNIKNLSEGKQQSFAKDDVDAMVAFLRQ